MRAHEKEQAKTRCQQTDSLPIELGTVPQLVGLPKNENNQRETHAVGHEGKNGGVIKTDSCPTTRPARRAERAKRSNTIPAADAARTGRGP